MVAEIPEGEKLIFYASSKIKTRLFFKKKKKKKLMIHFPDTFSGSTVAAFDQS